MKHVDQDRLERWLIRKTRKLKIKAGKKPSSSLDHENNKQSGKRPVLIWDNVNSTVIWSNEQLKYFSVCSLYISKRRNFIHFFYTDPHRPSLSKWKVSKPNDIAVCTYMCSFFCYLRHKISFTGLWGRFLWHLKLPHSKHWHLIFQRSPFSFKFYFYFVIPSTRFSVR